MNNVDDSKMLELINKELPERRMVDTPFFVLLLPFMFIEWAGDMCNKVRPVFLASMVQVASASERRHLCELVKGRTTVRRFHLWKLRNRLRMIARRKQDRAAQRILLAGCCK